MTIKINDLREAGESGGGLMGFWARGHHPLYDFVACVNAYTGADPNYDLRYVPARGLTEAAGGCVRHEWWRAVPISGEPGCTAYHPAEPRTRGAFPVTVTTVLRDRSNAQVQQTIDMHHRGCATGFARGVSWACRILDEIDPAVSEKLQQAYYAREAS